MAGLKADHMDYRGVVFIGLMIENKQPKVLELMCVLVIQKHNPSY